MLKVLIIGSSGILGREIFEKLIKKKNIKLFHTGLRRRIIDFRNKNKLKKFIFSIDPDLIINCIAYTNVDECEHNYKISEKINVQIVKEIFKIKVQKKMNFKLIQFSTDQFYNKKKNKSSKENDKTFLLNNYCKHKKLAEIVCARNNCLIFRTNFFGKSKSKNKSFSDWVYKNFRAKKKIFLFKDVYFNPLSITTIANIISFLIDEKKFFYKGIYNLGTRDAVYKNELAKSFAKKAKIYIKNYTDVNVNDFLKVRRPTNMFMDVNKFEKKFGFKLPYIRTEIIKEVNKYLKT